LAKVSSVLQTAFPAPTNVFPVSYNPSELVARGAAIQASLISSFDAETIAEAIHPVVTVVGHLLHPVGVKTHDGKLDVVLEGESAVPCRGKRVYLASGGDVVIEVFEGKRQTEVIATPPTPPPEEDGEQEEEEPIRRRIVVPERKMAALRVKGVKKGAKVEVQIQVDPDGRVVIVGRELGRKDGGVAKGVV
jgi:molecular chaperone DnaK (HSP70)